jgi:hypothetical protein
MGGGAPIFERLGQNRLAQPKNRTRDTKKNRKFEISSGKRMYGQGLRHQIICFRYQTI